jgi:hypothetical protein
MLGYLFAAGPFMGFTGYLFSKWSAKPAEDDPKKLVKNTAAYSWSAVVVALSAFFAFVKPSLSTFDSLGVWTWFTSPRPTQASQGCTLFPDSPSLTESPIATSTRPTAWTSHIAFLYGFLLTNALALYSVEKPVLQNEAELTRDVAKSRKAKIEERYANRRSKTLTIAILLTVIFGLLLLFRYWKTACEDSVWLAAPALFWTGLFGSAWFTFLTGECGVLPTDVLGFAAGMKSPDLTENPIVCVGNSN